MRKFFCYLLCFCVLFNLYGCKKRGVTGEEVLKKFDISKAVMTADEYMRAAMKNDTEAMNKLYSKELKSKQSKNDTKKTKDSNVVINGYSIEEVAQSGEKGIVRVKVTKINSNSPYASLETTTFNVFKEGKDYRIKSIDSKNEKEIFLDNKQLRVRNRNDSKNYLVTSFDGIPKYTYTQEDKAKITKVDVSKDAFGITTLNYEGANAAISTKGPNPFIEIVHFDESVMTQGGGKQGEEGAPEGGAEGGEGTTQKNMAPEKPVASDIVPLDVLKDSTIYYMAYSVDQKYLAVQYSKGGLGKTLKLYQTKKGELASFDFTKKYPMDKVDVNIIAFDKKGLNYEVVPLEKSKDDPALKDISGKWFLDLKKFKADKKK